MALIQTVAPADATGVVKEGYDIFMKNLGTIPKPLEMMSASPAMFELQLRRIRYLSQHPTLSFALLAHIRYLVAHTQAYRFCMDFNRMILKKQGLTDDDIRRMEDDPAQSLLEENERVLLAFVVKAVKAPDSVAADDVDRLRQLGWTDQDLVDAMSQGVGMIDHAIMMQAFQMDQDCLVV